MAKRHWRGDRAFLRRVLFGLPPEIAHTLALRSLQIATRCGWHQSTPSAPRSLMGLTFPNPLGLAAGLDKNAEYIDALAALGFGFIEVGTVTPKPQAGNPRPRLFRLPEAEAIINRMGFNNHGMHAMAKRLAHRTYTGILGINIGKNRDTPADKAIDDYVQCFKTLSPFADYITINISSPNTPGLRDWQSPDKLAMLLQQLKETQQTARKPVPLVVKIAPDMTIAELTDMATLLLTHEIDGVIATNTTTSREGVSSHPLANESGGLSGAPLRDKATATVRTLTGLLQNKIPVIGCGGIFTKADADEKFFAGASLIQLYTGLIYQGPGIVPALLET